MTDGDHRSAWNRCLAAWRRTSIQYGRYGYQQDNHVGDRRRPYSERPPVTTPRQDIWTRTTYLGRRRRIYGIYCKAPSRNKNVEASSTDDNIYGGQLVSGKESLKTHFSFLTDLMPRHVSTGTGERYVTPCVFYVPFIGFNKMMSGYKMYTLATDCVNSTPKRHDSFTFVRRAPHEDTCSLPYLKTLIFNVMQFHPRQ